MKYQNKSEMHLSPKKFGGGGTSNLKDTDIGGSLIRERFSAI